MPIENFNEPRPGRYLLIQEVSEKELSELDAAGERGFRDTLIRVFSSYSEWDGDNNKILSIKGRTCYGGNF